MIRFKLSPVYVALCAGLMCLSGCANSVLNMSFFSEKHDKESIENPVEQVVPTWQEAEGPSVDQKTVSRGFSGQIYFITGKRGLPSEVNGKVRIYVFDDQGNPEDLAKPIHQFDFTPEAWKAHLTMSKLGPSYSVFVPYPRPGRNAAQCALRIRYTPAESKAPAVFSQLVTIAMPGAKGEFTPNSNITPIKRSNEYEDTMPQVTQKKRKVPQRVAQASASDDLMGRGHVQPASFDNPAGRPASRGRVRMADHAEYDDEADLQSVRQVRADVIEEDVDEEYEEVPAPPRRTRKPQRKLSASETFLGGSVDDDDDGESGLKTYTIPLGD